MAAGAFLAITALSSYMNYKSQQDYAEAQEDAADLAAQKAQEAADLARQQLIEQHELDISLAQEQVALEKEVYLESTQYVTGQIEKRDAEVRAAAIAGYAASGIGPYEEDSSALSVLTRIEEESLGEQERVTKGYTTFIEARELEMSQLVKSTSRTFEWFMQQSEFELEYELASRHLEASMYRKQSGYAKWGTFLGPLGSLGRGYSTLSIT